MTLDPTLPPPPIARTAPQAPPANHATHAVEALPAQALARTRIKICGLTREEDVDAAVAAGADAVGFVLFAPSPRAVTPQRAAQLARRIRGEVLMATGLMDDICPPSTQFAADNRITAPKNMLIYPDFGHEALPGCDDRMYRFMLGL